MPPAPRRPTAPHAPTAPTAPTAGQPGQPGRRQRKSRSKTGNAKCSAAASAWQLAIRRGTSPGADVYKTLAQCRAANRTAKQTSLAVSGGRMNAHAGAGLISRARGDRIDRGLATATSRKDRLKQLLHTRARRDISSADRQRANDIASRVTGNKASGPSDALRRLQGVRQRRTTGRPTTATPAKPEAKPVIQGPRVPSIGLDAMRQRQARQTGGSHLAVDARRNAAAGLMALRRHGLAGRLDAQAIRNSVANTATDGTRSPGHARALRISNAIVSERQGRGQAFNRMAENLNQRAFDGGRRGDNTVLFSGTAENRGRAARELAALRRMRNASHAATGTRGPTNYWRGSATVIQAGKPRHHMRENGRYITSATGDAVSVSGRNRGSARNDYMANYARGEDAANRDRATAQRQQAAPAATQQQQAAYDRASMQRDNDWANRRIAQASGQAQAGGYSTNSSPNAGRNQSRRQRNANHWNDYFEQRRQLPGMSTFRAPVSTTGRGSAPASAATIRQRERDRDVALGITATRGTTEYWRQVASAEHRHMQASGLSHPHTNRSLASAAASGVLGRAPEQTNSRGDRIIPAPTGGYVLARAQRQHGAPHSPTAPLARDHHASTPANARNEHVDVPAQRQIGTSRYTDAELAAARQQAGPIPNYAAHSRHTAQERASHVARAEAMGFRLQGSTSDERFSHLVALSGVPHAYADRVSVGGYGNEISINIPGGSRTLKTFTTSTGTHPMIYNNVFFPGDRMQANGQAIDMYSRSAMAARAAGVHQIQVSGAGSGNGRDGIASSGATGYTVWPQYGFDGRMDDASPTAAARVRGAHPDLAEARNFSDAFFHPNPEAREQARAAWTIHHNGSMPKVTLNLKDTNSASYRNFSEHFARTQRSSGHTLDRHSVNHVVTRNGGYEAPGT